MIRPEHQPVRTAGTLPATSSSGSTHRDQPSGLPRTYGAPCIGADDQARAFEIAAAGRLRFREPRVAVRRVVWWSEEDPDTSWPPRSGSASSTIESPCAVLQAAAQAPRRGGRSPDVHGIARRVDATACWTGRLAHRRSSSAYYARKRHPRAGVIARLCPSDPHRDGREGGSSSERLPARSGYDEPPASSHYTGSMRHCRPWTDASAAVRGLAEQGSLQAVDGLRGQLRPAVNPDYGCHGLRLRTSARRRRRRPSPVERSTLIERENAAVEPRRAVATLVVWRRLDHGSPEGSGTS